MVFLNHRLPKSCFAPLDDPSWPSPKEICCSPQAYPFSVDAVEVRETHISWIFLAGPYAYKVKKAIQTGFLDYSNLALRKHFCEEEVRLNSRYTDDLYLGVVPIAVEPSGEFLLEGKGIPIEYAVKMHRFSDDALLSHRVDAGTLTGDDVHAFAGTLAHFHTHAKRCERERALGVPTLLANDIRQILKTLTPDSGTVAADSLESLRNWAGEYFADHEQDFVARGHNGFIRECHGDLHLNNIVSWRGKLVPFDGIEFNQDFRFIDVMNDAAFLAMDLAAHRQMDLSRIFVNSYLEQTGDHASLSILRWYLVYRSLIRAMVAKIRADQHAPHEPARFTDLEQTRDHIDLAHRFTLRQIPSLLITHGLSGSGKTTASEIVVARKGAIRLKSDIERKRHFGLTVGAPLTPQQKSKVYCQSANQATYCRLERLAKGILRDGYSVIIDAAFLKRAERDRFRQLAETRGVHFAIIDCQADPHTLQQRIVDRLDHGNDASDADLSVLELQLKSQEPLTESEQKFVVDIPGIVDTVDQL
ncbi:MAG: AAA family ATPase [Pirellulales bacterium]|nr:AAA family ATPase [Pirellulales bacterium]